MVIKWIANEGHEGQCGQVMSARYDSHSILQFLQQFHDIVYV